MSDAKQPCVRNPRIDALKFFAIVLVVISHTLGRAEWTAYDDRLVAAIVAFNLPLFVYLSGYVLYGREGSSQWVFVRKKFRSLMVPRYSWIVIYSLIGGMALVGLPSRLVKATVDCSGLWFLYVLFLFFVIFSLTRLLPASDTVLVAVVMTLWLSKLFTSSSTTLLGYKYVYLLPYFVAGYLVARHQKILSRWRKPVLVLAPIGFMLMLVLAPPTNGADPAWYFAVREFLHGLGLPGSYLLLMAHSVGLAALGIATSWALYSVLPASILRPQAWAGRYSLGIYVAEGLFVSWLIGGGVIGMLATAAAHVLLALALSRVIDQIPIARTILLGRPMHGALPTVSIGGKQHR